MKCKVIILLLLIPIISSNIVIGSFFTFHSEDIQNDNLDYFFPFNSSDRRELNTKINNMPPEPGDLTIKNTSFYQNEIENNVFLVSKTVEKNHHFVNYNISNLIEQIDKNLIISVIENITAFGPRVTGSESCDNTGRWIFQEFKNMGLEVRYHNWSTSSTLYGSNIEATLPGADPNSEEIYIVCGHYDSVYGSPGADDNGAGTAAVLASAQVMSNYSFNHTIRFITFSGEEQGLHGSYHYAKESYENDEQIMAVLNADMMGYAQNKESEGKVIVFDNAPSSWITDLSVNVSSKYGDLINLEIIHGGYSGRSDHASFHVHEYNAIFYFEYEMNPHYHSSKDTLENMNPGYASNVSRLILATLSELSDFVPQLPPKTPQRPIGRMNGRSGKEYVYETKAIDPNADDVYYKWSWGDGSVSEWLGPFESNTIHSVAYSWNENGKYEVKVKAKDAVNAESDWSEPLVVNMPRNRFSLLNFNFFERFNFLYQFLI
jgi:hypothetical protein